jgi:hypothetical protein
MRRQPAQRLERRGHQEARRHRAANCRQDQEGEGRDRLRLLARLAGGGERQRDPGAGRRGADGGRRPGREVRQQRYAVGRGGDHEQHERLDHTQAYQPKHPAAQQGRDAACAET